MQTGSEALRPDDSLDAVVKLLSTEQTITKDSLLRVITALDQVITSKNSQNSSLFEVHQGLYTEHKINRLRYKDYEVYRQLMKRNDHQELSLILEEIQENSTQSI